ncbi:MAG: recombination protein O N-terminal domain-containing protein [bacterium]|nr:recombination protein O N-terminal domain-containing protein [bacterium]
MIEHYTEAIVLDKEGIGETDSRIFLYTETMGKIVAKAKSARKITSKLSAHLEPLTWSAIRLIKNKDWQITDALRQHRLNNKQFLGIFRLIKDISPIEHADPWLWQLLKTLYENRYSADTASLAILKISGFDPKHANCHNCSHQQPEHFLLNSAKYICHNCWSASGMIEPTFKLLTR